MGTLLAGDVASAPELCHRRGAAVLTSGCDGYAAGTTGRVLGRRDGCAVFAPDHPERVARWASPRAQVLVPESLLAVL